MDSIEAKVSDNSGKRDDDYGKILEKKDNTELNIKGSSKSISVKYKVKSKKKNTFKNSRASMTQKLKECRKKSEEAHKKWDEYNKKWEEDNKKWYEDKLEDQKIQIKKLSERLGVKVEENYSNEDNKNKSSKEIYWENSKKLDKLYDISNERYRIYKLNNFGKSKDVRKEVDNTIEEDSSKRLGKKIDNVESKLDNDEIDLKKELNDNKVDPKDEVLHDEVSLRKVESSEVEMSISGEEADSSHEVHFEGNHQDKIVAEEEVIVNDDNESKWSDMQILLENFFQNFIGKSQDDQKKIIESAKEICKIDKVDNTSKEILVPKIEASKLDTITDVAENKPVVKEESVANHQDYESSDGVDSVTQKDNLSKIDSESKGIELVDIRIELKKYSEKLNKGSESVSSRFKEYRNYLLEEDRDSSELYAFRGSKIILGIPSRIVNWNNNQVQNISFLNRLVGEKSLNKFHRCSKYCESMQRAYDFSKKIFSLSDVKCSTLLDNKLERAADNLDQKLINETRFINKICVGKLSSDKFINSTTEIFEIIIFKGFNRMLNKNDKLVISRLKEPNNYKKVNNIFSNIVKELKIELSKRLEETSGKAYQDNNQLRLQMLDKKINIKVKMIRQSNSRDVYIFRREIDKFLKEDIPILKFNWELSEICEWIFGKAGKYKSFMILNDKEPSLVKERLVIYKNKTKGNEVSTREYIRSIMYNNPNDFFWNYNCFEYHNVKEEGSILMKKFNALNKKHLILLDDELED